jgi:hypothetical protein
VGEIKSTLDLVMEKTRNLTLSSEEKQAQKQKEIESRIKGLIQKLLDGLLTKDQLGVEYETLKSDMNLADDSLLINEILIRMNVDHDHQHLLAILEKFCRIDTTAIRAAIDDHRVIYSQAAQKRAARLKEDLLQKYSIEGSAVVPDLDADEQWQREAQDLRMQLENRLRQAMDQR